MGAGRGDGRAPRGLVTGTGRFTLEPLDDGRRTRFTWEEELTFPWWLGGPLGAARRRADGDAPDLAPQPRAAQDTRRTTAVTAAPRTITTISGARRHAATPRRRRRRRGRRARGPGRRERVLARSAPRSAPPGRAPGSARRPAAGGATDDDEPDHLEGVGTGGEQQHERPGHGTPAVPGELGRRRSCPGRDADAGPPPTRTGSARRPA